ncbi:hypothetical protein O3G_MSEX008746 [Manduca sexta]|uniref:Uncharacterized protein n=1 Tax=Manduca sexta TaxID=7130 RepID=A0A921ZAZ0_MANSE|nr:hypothetical protein O3G_MSEX008746 [Manduca sexta]
MYPSLFVIGMVGYCKLEVRRDVGLVKLIFKVWRGWVHLPEVLSALQLCVPSGRVSTRRHLPLFRLQTPRTNILRFAPASRAIRLLNTISQNLDIFICNLSEFTEMAHKCIEINC